MKSLTMNKISFFFWIHIRFNIFCHFHSYFIIDIFFICFYEIVEICCWIAKWFDVKFHIDILVQIIKILSNEFSLVVIVDFDVNWKILSCDKKSRKWIEKWIISIFDDEINETQFFDITWIALKKQIIWLSKNDLKNIQIVNSTCFIHCRRLE